MVDYSSEEGKEIMPKLINKSFVEVSGVEQIILVLKYSEECEGSWEKMIEWAKKHRGKYPKILEEDLRIVNEVRSFEKKYNCIIVESDDLKKGEWALSMGDFKSTVKRKYK